MVRRFCVIYLKTHKGVLCTGFSPASKIIGIDRRVLKDYIDTYGYYIWVDYMVVEIEGKEVGETALENLPSIDKRIDKVSMFEGSEISGEIGGEKSEDKPTLQGDAKKMFDLAEAVRKNNEKMAALKKS